MRVFHREPAMLALPGLSAVVAVILHLASLTPATSAIIAAAGVAVGTIVTASRTTPPEVTVIAGAVGTFATVISHYWLHLSPQLIAEGVVALTTLLGLILRVHVTPVSKPIVDR